MSQQRVSADTEAPERYNSKVRETGEYASGKCPAYSLFYSSSTSTVSWEGARMFKYMNPKRFYHAVGRKKFLEFLLLAVFILFFYGPMLNMLMLAFANI